MNRGFHFSNCTNGKCLPNFSSFHHFESVYVICLGCTIILIFFNCVQSKNCKCRIDEVKIMLLNMQNWVWSWGFVTMWSFKCDIFPFNLWFRENVLFLVFTFNEAKRKDAYDCAIRKKHSVSRFIARYLLERIRILVNENFDSVLSLLQRNFAKCNVICVLYFVQWLLYSIVIGFGQTFISQCKCFVLEGTHWPVFNTQHTFHLAQRGHCTQCCCWLTNMHDFSVSQNLF